MQMLNDFNDSLAQGAKAVDAPAAPAQPAAEPNGAPAATDSFINGGDGQGPSFKTHALDAKLFARFKRIQQAKAEKALAAWQKLDKQVELERHNFLTLEEALRFLKARAGKS